MNEAKTKPAQQAQPAQPEKPLTGLQKFNRKIMDVNIQAYLTSVLGAKKDSFINNVTAMVGNSASLQKCEPMTLMYAAMKATALGLPLDQNLGFVHVIPYQVGSTGRYEAQLQFGYKAYTQLAVRSKEVEKINVSDVREGELKGRNRRTGDIIFEWIDDNTEREKKRVIGYIGFVRLKSGYEKEIYRSVEELTAHANKYSQTFKKGYGVWVDNFNAMCEKTIIKMLLNKGDIPLSIEMADALAYDQAVITDENGSYKYVDNTKPTAAGLASQALSQEAIEEAEAEDVTKEQSPELFNDGAEPANE